MLQTFFPWRLPIFYFTHILNIYFLNFSELGTYSHVYSHVKIIFSPHNYILTLAELYEIYIDISKSGI